VVVVGTNGIVGFDINGVLVTVDWGNGGGPLVSTKFHDPLVVDGLDGNVPPTEIGSTGVIRTKSGSNR